MSDADDFELLLHYHQTIFRTCESGLTVLEDGFGSLVVDPSPTVVAECSVLFSDSTAVLTVPDSSETVSLLWSFGHQTTPFLPEPILVCQKL